jgi:hypothetical protein
MSSLLHSEAVREVGMGSPDRPHAGLGKIAKALFCLASDRFAGHLRSACLTLFAHPLSIDLRFQPRTYLSLANVPGIVTGDSHGSTLDGLAAAVRLLTSDLGRLV